MDLKRCDNCQRTTSNDAGWYEIEELTLEPKPEPVSYLHLCSNKCATAYFARRMNGEKRSFLQNIQFNIQSPSPDLPDVPSGETVKSGPTWKDDSQ